MLEKDPEFYRKWVSILSLSDIRPLTMSVVVNKLYFYHGNKLLKEMGTATYFHASVNEIIKILGVPRNVRQDEI